MSTVIDHEAYRKFCRVGDTSSMRPPLTTRQSLAYQAWKKHRSLTKAAEELGLTNTGTLSSILQTVEMKGYNL